MKDKPLTSIIIATFNSAQLLPKVLQSLKQQSYPTASLELLVIDGGSTDGTQKIALAAGARVIANPKTVPAWAKYLGYLEAKGRYIMYLDSDEIFEANDSIERKVALLQAHRQIHAVVGSGYKSPSGYAFINQYINEFGDPFSYFYYGLSKDARFFIPTMKARYRVIQESRDYLIFDFSHEVQLPIFELVAMASMVDLSYLKKNIPIVEKTPGLIPHIFHLLVSQGSQIGIIKHDPLIHYSADTIQKYLGKIASRVVNNVFTPATEGFRGRSEYSREENRYKRFLFIPYALTLIGPCVDSLFLSITRGTFQYFIHVPLSLYTAILIMYYMIVRSLGLKPTLKSYGGTQKLRQ